MSDGIKHLQIAQILPVTLRQFYSIVNTNNIRWRNCLYYNIDIVYSDGEPHYIFNRKG